MKDTLLLQDKTNGKYEEYEQELEEKYGEDFDFESATAEAKDGKALTRQQRLKGKLQAVIDDAASTEGEKENAKKKLMLLTPEVIENNYLMRIERKLEKIERQKKKLKVKELSFNTYYEFALERIPQILHQQHSNRAYRAGSFPSSQESLTSFESSFQEYSSIKNSGA